MTDSTNAAARLAAIRAGVAAIESRSVLRPQAPEADVETRELNPRLSPSQVADRDLAARCLKGDAALADDLAKRSRGRERDARRYAPRRAPTAADREVVAAATHGRNDSERLREPASDGDTNRQSVVVTLSSEKLLNASTCSVVPAKTDVPVRSGNAMATPKQPPAKALPSWLTEHLRACGAHACLAPPAPPADPLDNLLPFPAPRSARASPPATPWDELLEAGGAR